MAESSQSIDQRTSRPMKDERLEPARWKVSTRILELLQSDRQKAAQSPNPWGTRSANVPVRSRTNVAPPRISAVPVDDRKDVTSDDRIPAWLISLILHMLAVLLMAFIAVKSGQEGITNRIVMEWTQPAEDGLSSFKSVVTQQSPELDESDATSSDSELLEGRPFDISEQLTNSLVEVPSPRSVASEPRTSFAIESILGIGPNVSLDTNLNGGRLGDRSSEGRAAAVQSGATTGEAEDAMQLALRWLANHQHRDGGWSFRLSDEEGPCHGQCENPIVNAEDAPLPRTAATGLCLLAFMGAGNTHKDGEYAENVRMGIYYLRSQARETSLGTDLQNGSMYGHGIAALALAEAYVLTSDPDLVDLVKGTTAFCAGAQHTSGGWGYMPGGPPDITLTGWQIVALKTGEQRRIRVPTQVFPNAKSYVATLADDTGIRYGYKTPEPKLSTTAIGVLLQLYFGMLPGQTEIREALNWIAKEGPSETNVYYNYYAMLAMHHSRHQESMRFAKELREYLITTQSKSGHQRGSWHFPDRYGSVGGRLYTTAMCALILQTPYRYIPLHDR